MIVIPQQGQCIRVFIVKEDEYTAAVFTHKVQAEAYIRQAKAASPRYSRFVIYEYLTEPHDNNC